MTLDENSIIRIAKEVLHSRGIKPVTSISVLHGGSENFNLLVEAKSKFLVITFFPQKNLRQIRNLSLLLLALIKNGVIKDTNPRIMYSEDKRCPVMIRDYIEGDILTAERFDANNQHILGKIIAYVHNIKNSEYIKDIPSKPNYGANSMRKLLLGCENIRLKEYSLDFIKNIYTKIDTSLPRSIIHGDIFLDNIIIDNQGRMHLMDFEEACFYFCLYDLGMAISGTCINDNSIDFSKAVMLLDGYSSIRKLADNEKNHLKSFVAYAALSTSIWRYNQETQRKNRLIRKGSFNDMLLLYESVLNIDDYSWDKKFKGCTDEDKDKDKDYIRCSRG